MENVYALVKRFYLAHGRAQIFVPRTLTERYLREAAWRGESAEGLCTRTFSRSLCGAMIRSHGF